MLLLPVLLSQEVCGFRQSAVQWLNRAQPGFGSYFPKLYSLKFIREQLHVHCKLPKQKYTKTYKLLCYMYV